MPVKEMQQPWRWKRCANNAIDSYVGLKDEVLFDLRGLRPVLRVMDGVTPGGDVLGQNMIIGAGTPSITFPINNQYGINTSPLLTASGFIGVKTDFTPDTHAATYWEIASDSNFNTVVHASGRDTDNLTHYDLDLANVYLDGDVYYFVRVRYESSEGFLSDWSAPVQFQTAPWFPDQYRSTLNQGVDAAGGAQYGRGVAVSNDGTLVVVGAFGSVSYTGYAYVYEYVNNAWVFRARLERPSGTTNDYMGFRIAISADNSRIFVSAYGVEAGGNYNVGEVLVFDGGGSTWTLTAQLHSDGYESNQFMGVGLSCSDDGKRVVVGAYRENTFYNGNGAAYVFEEVGGTWSQIAKLLADVPAQQDYFGYHCSMRGDGLEVLIGSDRVAVTGPGGVFVFEDYDNNSTFQFAQKVVGSDCVDGDRFGQRVEYINATSFVAVSVGTNSYKGTAYVFEHNGSQYNQTQSFTVTIAANGDHFGHSLAAAPGLILLASYRYNGEDGAVAVFMKINGTWTEVDIVHPPTTGLGDRFGQTVATGGGGLVTLVSEQLGTETITDQGLVHEYTP